MLAQIVQLTITDNALIGQFNERVVFNGFTENSFITSGARILWLNFFYLNSAQKYIML